MNATALRTIGSTMAERAMGQQPGRTRAMAAALFAGVATAAATYKLLRSAGGDED
jgi:hypothetical protein